MPLLDGHRGGKWGGRAKAFALLGGGFAARDVRALRLLIFADPFAHRSLHRFVACKRLEQRFVCEDVHAAQRGAPVVGCRVCRTQSWGYVCVFVLRCHL
jgi:hypothetical protein